MLDEEAFAGYLEPSCRRSGAVLELDYRNVMKRAFDYATIGIRPHVETGEFVTVGVVAYDAKAGEFDFVLMKPGQSGRVKKMFPQLPDEFRKVTLRGLESELEALKKVLAEGRKKMSGLPLFGNDGVPADGLFSAITTSRDGLFMYPAKGRRMGENLPEVLATLRRRFLKQQGLETAPAVEGRMVKDLRDLLEGEHLLQLYRRDAEVGPENYRIRFALAHLKGGEPHRADRAMRPLNFDLKDSTKIFNHADEWRQKLQRLERFGFRPERCLVTYRAPQGGDAGREDAFAQVREDFRKDAIELVAESDHQGVLDFARIPEAADLRLGN